MLLRHFQVFFSVAGKTLSFLFPSKTDKKFPSQLDKIGWFPSQLIKFISQPGIPRAFKSLDSKRPNKSDKTGTKQVFSTSAITTLSSRRMFVTTLWEREGVSFFFFRPQSSEFLQPARVEMLEKVSNSQAKPLSIINFPASSSKHLYFCQPARFLWGTDNVRNRFVGCP